MTRAISLLVTWCLSWVGAACTASRPQRLQYASLVSPSMQRPMQYGLYLPPGFEPGESLPLVVFLHGAGDGPDCFDDNGVGTALDEAIDEGRVPRVIVAIPQGDLGYWSNWYDGSRWYETWVNEELVPHLVDALGTQPCPVGCHLVGISMGGYGALRFALHHPNRFASAATLSGLIMSSERMVALGDSWLFRTFLGGSRAFGPISDRIAIAREDVFVRWRSPEDVGVRLFVAWGAEDNDTIRGANRELVSHLEAHGVGVMHRRFDGGHEWEAWTPVLLEAIRHGVGVGSPHGE